MTAAGSVERHTGLPLSGKNLPPRTLVCTSPRMSSVLLGRAHTFLGAFQKDSSDQDVGQPNSSQAQPRAALWRGAPGSVGPALFLEPSKTDSSDQDVGQPNSSQAQPRAALWRGAPGPAALLGVRPLPPAARLLRGSLCWLAFQPDMENEDAAIAGTVLWDWVGGPGLRGAGVGSNKPGP